MFPVPSAAAKSARCSCRFALGSQVARTVTSLLKASARSSTKTASPSCFWLIV